MVQSFEFEIDVKVSANRMWWGVCKDAHNLWPKCLPEKIASVDYSEGKPVETGCVRHIHYHKGHHDFVHLKEKFEEVDNEKLKLTATCIEGGLLGKFFKHYKYTLEIKEHELGSKIHCFVEYVALTAHHVGEAVKEEASKIGKKIKEEAVKVEEKIAEAKHKHEEKECHEKAKVEEEVCEEEIKVEEGELKVKAGLTHIFKGVEVFLIEHKEYYTEAHLATYKTDTY